MAPHMPAAANLRGAAFMVASMTGFAIEDALFKSLTATLPPGYVLTLFGLSGLVVFALASAFAREPVLSAEMRRPRLLLRSGFEIAGRLFFALALAFVPLATTSAILQATPLVVIAGAALVLGERVGARRWAAVAAGFAGVLLILRPVPGDFSPTALFAVAATLGFAGRDLATRMSPTTVSARQLGTLGFIVVTCAGLVLLGWDDAPPRWLDAGEAWRVALTGLVGAGAYGALTLAMRTGEVSAVTPFRYARLLVALVFALVVFGERPDGLTLLGAGIIVLSGLIVLRRKQPR